MREDCKYTEIELCIIRDEEPDVRDFPTGTRLYFVQAPENPYDGRAVEVVNSRGVRAGYLYRGKLQDMANDVMDAGGSVVGEVAYYNGGKMLADLYFQRRGGAAPQPSQSSGKYTVYKRDTNVIKPAKEKGSLKPAIWLCVFFLFVLIGVAGQNSDSSRPSRAESTPPAASTTPKQEPEEEKVPTAKYLEKIEWADHRSLLVAVEVDDYGGDAIKAGTWTAEEIDIANLGGGKVPIVWDIYVLDSSDVGSGEIALNDEDLVCTAGGIGSEGQKWEFSVKSGQYVAIYYNEMAGKPRGTLKLELKK